jgi:hypothetical protein
MLKRFDSLMAAALVGSLVGGGCTHWGATTVYGERREVGRQLLGAPQVAESTSGSLSASLFGTSGQSPITGANAVAGNAFASHDSSTRTHCVQQAEIQYVQPYQVIPRAEGRFLDIAGAVTLASTGLLVVAGAAIAGQPGAIPPGDPLYQPPPNVTPAYILGAAMILGGAAWLWYSHSSLPSGPPPPVQNSERKWTATEFVEAMGCGLVPGDAVIAGGGAGASAGGGKQDRDVTARLQGLEKAHKAGLLTDDEYKRKRQEMIDGM